MCTRRCCLAARRISFHALSRKQTPSPAHFKRVNCALFSCCRRRRRCCRQCSNGPAIVKQRQDHAASNYACFIRTSPPCCSRLIFCPIGRARARGTAGKVLCFPLQSSNVTCTQLSEDESEFPATSPENSRLDPRSSLRMNSRTSSNCCVAQVIHAPHDSRQQRRAHPQAKN